MISPIIFNISEVSLKKIHFSIRCMDCSRAVDWSHDPSPEELTIKVRVGCSVCKANRRIKLLRFLHRYDVVFED